MVIVQDGSGKTGETSIYVKVKTSKMLLGSIQLDVDAPASENIKTVHFYMNNEEIHSGPETTYTATELENGEDYTFHAIVDYNNTKISTSITYQGLPSANIYVSTTGNNTEGLGDGSADKPYATIAKAINSATSGQSIYIMPGTYNATSMSGAAINDSGKRLEIFGANENTIINWDATSISERDSTVLTISNANTIVRNLTFVFKPKSGSTYQRAIFKWCTAGYVKNVFFRISGNNSASYLYNNDGGSVTVSNCTFFHDKGSVDGNYSGSASFNNIATNVNTNGTNTNVKVEAFGTSSDTIAELITKSKNNSVFNANEVGVFHGTNAWE